MEFLGSCYGLHELTTL